MDRPALTVKTGLTDDPRAGIGQDSRKERWVLSGQDVTAQRVTAPERPWLSGGRKVGGPGWGGPGRLYKEQLFTRTSSVLPRTSGVRARHPPTGQRGTGPWHHGRERARGTTVEGGSVVLRRREGPRHHGRGTAP